MAPFATKRERMARILITSALPYINGVKHLGNLAGSMLPADAYARFKRAQGHEVLYICATDEHGTPAELAAAAAAQDVASYCGRTVRASEGDRRPIRLVLRLVRPLVQPAESRADPAFRPRAGAERLHRGAHRPDGLFARRRPLPARPLCGGGPARSALFPRRAATSATTAAACSTLSN